MCKASLWPNAIAWNNVDISLVELYMALYLEQFHFVNTTFADDVAT